jgi:hypothetical protein
MRTTKSTPSNQQFFTEHGGRIRALQIIGVAGQLLSAGSLYYAVYAIIASQLQAAGGWVLAAAAAVTALMIELSNKALAKPAIKPFVVNALPNSPEHRILNRAYLAGLVVVAGLSFYLSATGSKYLAHDIAPPATAIRQDSIQAAYLAQKNATEQRYLADTATLLQGYKIRLQAAAIALQAVEQRQANCTRPACLQAVARARAQYATQTARIAQQQQQAIEQHRERMYSELTTLTAEHKQQQQQATQFNATQQQQQQQQTGQHAILLIIITAVGQIALYFTTYLICVIEQGAGISYTVTPNEFWNLPPVLAELATLASWRAERAARIALANTLGSKPPERNTAIYYPGLYRAAAPHNGHNGHRVNGYTVNGNGYNGHNGSGHRITTNGTQHNGSTRRINEQMNFGFGAPENSPQGHHNATNGGGYTNGQQHANNGTSAKQGSTTTKNGAYIAHTNGSHHESTNGSAGTHNGTTNGNPAPSPAPSTNGGTAGSINANRYAFVGGIDSCEFCGGSYTRKTTRQRFCGDACRLNFHAAKHNGQKYEPGRRF